MTDMRVRRGPRRALWEAPLGLALAAAALLGSGTALAAPPKVLAFPYQRLQDSLPEDLGEQTTLIVTREIGHGEVRVERGRALAKPRRRSRKRRPSDAPTGNPKAEARAERIIERGVAAMEDGRMPAAARRLERAVTILERNGDAVADLRVLADAYLQLGIARFRDGLEDEADEALRKAVHFAPERTLDASRFPPIFVKVYERARYDVLSRPRAKVEVRAAPGARVLLDGRSMGTAPVLLEEVLPGPHWIRVERPGEAVQAKTLSIRSGKTTVVTLDGAPAAGREPSRGAGVLAAVADNELAPEHLEVLRRAGRKARADFVLVGAIFGTDTAYQIRTGLLDVKTGQIGRAVDIAFDLDLLSAEIEVFKLAEDVQAQVEAGALARPDSGPAFVPAPDYEPIQSRRPAGGARMSTKRAAPPAPRKPRSLYAKAPAAPSGRAPVNSADPGPEPEPEAPAPREARRVVPKDEQPGAASASPDLEIGASRPGDEDEGGSDLWWVWVLVGVAAAGAASAATVAVVSDQGADQGTLRIRW